MSTKKDKRRRKRKAAIMQRDLQAMLERAGVIMKLYQLQKIEIIKRDIPGGGYAADLIIEPDITSLSDDLRAVYEGLCCYMSYKEIEQLNIKYDPALAKIEIVEKRINNSAIMPFNCLSGNAINQLIR